MLSSKSAACLVLTTTVGGCFTAPAPGVNCSTTSACPTGQRCDPGRQVCVADDCEPGDFSAARLVEGLPTDEDVRGPSLSADGLTLYYQIRYAALYRATRPNRAAPFGESAIVAGTNTSEGEGFAEISSDGLSLYFARRRVADDWDLFHARRAGPAEPFAEPIEMSTLNRAGTNDWAPSVNASNDTLVYARLDANTRSRLYIAHRESSGEFGESMAIEGFIDDNRGAGGPELLDHADGSQTLYFASGRDGGHGSGDIWMTTRPSPNAPWEAPRNLGTAINSAASEADPDVTPDGLQLIFSSEPVSSEEPAQLYEAFRECDDD